MVTLLATVLAAPLLLVEIAPGADAGPDAALTAYRTQVEVDSPARAVGSLTSEDLTSTRLFATLSVGDQLRAEAAQAEAEAADAAEAAAEAEAAEQAEALREAQAAAVTPRPAPPVTTTTTSAPPATLVAPEPPNSGPTAEQWAALRQCESSGDYTVVSRNGLYYGAYQFSIPTWDSIAAHVGRTDLVGVPPNHAAPADQDALAVALYHRSGPGQWPHCGAYLR